MLGVHTEVIFYAVSANPVRREEQRRSLCASGCVRLGVLRLRSTALHRLLLEMPVQTGGWMSANSPRRTRPGRHNVGSLQSRRPPGYLLPEHRQHRAGHRAHRQITRLSCARPTRHRTHLSHGALCRALRVGRLHLHSGSGRLAAVLLHHGRPACGSSPDHPPAHLLLPALIPPAPQAREFSKSYIVHPTSYIGGVPPPPPLSNHPRAQLHHIPPAPAPLPHAAGVRIFQIVNRKS